MRRPSDRAVLWRRWRERLAGVRPNDWHPDEPECGRYQAKRAGQYVAVQIDIEQDIDDDAGELQSEETFVAFVSSAHETKRFDGERMFDIWQRCGGKPITENEFRRLAGLPQIDDLGRTFVT